MGLRKMGKEASSIGVSPGTAGCSTGRRYRAGGQKSLAGSGETRSGWPWSCPTAVAGWELGVNISTDSQETGAAGE